MSTRIERSNGAIYGNSKPDNVPKGDLGDAGVHIQCESEEQAKLLKDHFEKVEKEEKSLPMNTNNKNGKNSSIFGVGIATAAGAGLGYLFSKHFILDSTKELETIRKSKIVISAIGAVIMGGSYLISKALFDKKTDD